MNFALQKKNRRKTSAEIVSEAKHQLLALGGENGARLVSTRRPITPAVAGTSSRHLYGNMVAPKERPPSSFSLRALKAEDKNLKVLEPIQSVPFEISSNSLIRSESFGTLGKSSRCPDKLPSLACPPRMSCSLEQLSTLKGCKRNNNVKAGNKDAAKAFVCEHPMKMQQQQRHDTKSLDEKIPNNNNKKGINEEKTKLKNSATLQDSNTTSMKAKLIFGEYLLSERSTESLLELLKQFNAKECSEEEIVAQINAILLELYLRAKCAQGKTRNAILGAVYELVECHSPRVLLSIARIVLVLKVTGSNLAGACKLVYKVAKQEKNDNLFIESNVPELLIDGLGNASPIDESEACTYGYGAVRFLAGTNQSVVDSQRKSIAGTLPYRMISHGIIQLMILHLQILNEVGSRKKLPTSALHALFQLCGALKVLSSSSIYENEEEHKALKSVEQLDSQLEQAAPQLVKAAEICLDEPEVQTHIIGTLSVLSEMEKCCQSLSTSAAKLGMLLGPIDHNTPEKSLGFLSRLGYVIGNIVSRYDVARLQFYNNDVALEYLFLCLDHFGTKKISTKPSEGESVADVLVKLVRVVANISVNPKVGYDLGKRSPIGATLLHLLISSKNAQTLELEELLLATLGALHNLSYYQDDTDDDQCIMSRQPGSFVERINDFVSVLYDVLNVGPDLAKPEATRVLGNLTRLRAPRDVFCSAGGLELLVKFLEFGDLELVANSCGVLVNILVDWERRLAFKRLKGPALLGSVLKRGAMQEDWLLAGIACQALWNLLSDCEVAEMLDDPDVLASDLAEYLDEEKLFKGNIPDVLWEQFAAVSSDLLEQIQSSLSNEETVKT